MWGLRPHIKIHSVFKQYQLQMAIVYASSTILALQKMSGNVWFHGKSQACTGGGVLLIQT